MKRVYVTPTAKIQIYEFYKRERKVENKDIVKNTLERKEGRKERKKDTGARKRGKKKEGLSRALGKEGKA